jgi:hypothetical protein
MRSGLRQRDDQAMEFNTSALERAVGRLEEAMEAYQKDTSQSLIGDGLVQRFEFTY